MLLLLFGAGALALVCWSQQAWLDLPRTVLVLVHQEQRLTL